MHWFGRRTLVVLGGLIVTLAFAQAATPPATSTAASSLLSWRPPTLTNPITVALCNCNIQNGVIVVNLAVGQDYVLTDSVVLTDPVLIQGGHNIVWIGGEVQPVGPATGIKLIRNAGYGGGTIHLEGIYIHGADGQLTDGIGGGEWASIYAPSGTLADATLQVENVRVGPLGGDSSVYHQDCIQHFGGWADLRVDHFTCQTPF